MMRCGVVYMCKKNSLKIGMIKQNLPQPQRRAYSSHFSSASGFSFGRYMPSVILSRMSVTVRIAPSVQTIVWDLDGTLLDSFGIYRDCLNEVLRKLGRTEIDEQIFRNHHHGFIEDSIANVLHEAGQTTTKAELAEIIRQFYVLD